MTRHPPAVTLPHYAHTRENRPESEWEPLTEHLRAVEARAAIHAGAFDSARWGALLGRWHDLGKYLPAFQARLRGSPERVDHAAPGAALAVELGGVAGRTLAFAVAGHHAGLANADAQGETRQRPLAERISRAGSDLALVRSVAPEELVTLEPPPLPRFLERLPNRTGTERERAFRRIELWTRFLFSALVDADRLETARFYGTGGRREFDTIPTLRERLDRTLGDFTAKTPVDRMRARVLADCRARAELPPGLFSLSVPTGGGKTLSGMAFALRHAELHQLRRVVVAIPFTSIIEQNAAVYAKALGAENVIEHHSAIEAAEETEEDREREVRRRLAAENWDAPVIVTTNVQLFESLFSNEPSRCRKLHNLAGSVIVLDEAQALPPEFLDCALDVLGELVEVYGCTVVLCTATQPALTRRENLPMGFECGSIREIIEEPKALAEALERVTVHWPEPGVVTPYADVAREMTRPGRDRVLAIVHLRKDARTLAELLPREDRFHLSALMCAAHRTEVLDAVRECLKRGGPCRLVATQLIEAGVDVSFPVVFRALAGLDSVAQAAGRCNRNGEIERGDLFVFLAETRPPPGLLLKGLESTRGMLAQHGPTLRLGDADTMDEYFRGYYAKCTTDEKGVQPQRAGMNFATVAARVRLIDDAWSAPLVVPWGDAMERVRRHEKSPTRETARALQRYLVQVPRTAFERGPLSGDATYALDDAVRVLSPSHAELYDAEFGLRIEKDG